MAGGHRCSLRHNVCRPATDAYICVYNRTNHLCEKCLSVIFLILYFICTTLLVKIHILCTQKWAAQCDAPLRSGKHTERIFVYKLYGFWFGYFINTALLVKIHILCTQKYGGRTSSFLTSQRMPSRYGCVHMLIQLCKYYTPSVASGHIPTHKFIHRTEIFDFVVR